jgi:pimeloyl-ACP methyl ester carboxylesterase
VTLQPRLSLTSFTAFSSAVLLMLLTGTGNASDIAKEQRWAEQLKDQLTVGEPLQLTADQQEFFAIYTPAEGKIQRGGVILLHGLGAHPDWPDVISPLRTSLPESGWATLSIQLPVWPNGVDFKDFPPLFPEANARISAAIRHLQQQGLLNIVLVGHSLGAAMGAHFLAEKAPGSDAIRAFVGIGMNQAPGTVAHTPDALAKIKLPVLDLYGALDLPGVLGSTKARAFAASQANNADYQQVAIAGADHFFHGLDATLIRRVSGWLTKVAPSTELKNGASTKP